MYKINFWQIAYASILSLLIITACSREYSPVTVSGQIWSAIDEQPLQGLQFSVETNRCELSGLNSCDVVHHEDITDENGEFRIYFTQDCANELHFTIPKELKAKYPKYRLLIEDFGGKYLPLSCQNNLLIYPEKNYKLNVILQPQMTLYLRPVSTNITTVDKILIPEFDIEMNQLIAAGSSKLLDITTMVGAIDIEIYYSDGSIVEKNLKYDYLIDQVITLDILN